MAVTQEEEGDQRDNVLGQTRFGTTEDLPTNGDLAKMVAYFYNLAHWVDRHPLVPDQIRRHVEERPGVYMLWVNPPMTYWSDENDEMAIARRVNGVPQSILEYYNDHTRLAYIGKSKRLSSRLGGYTMAVSPDRPPVYQIVRDRVMGHPRLAHNYLISSPSGMRALRRQWMKQRGLSFQVAYTETERDAFDLEATMVRYCNHHHLVMWNTLLYTTGVTWPRPA